MPADTEKWDARHRAGDQASGSEPAPLLRELLPLLPPPGRALDLAAGAGRNAVFLAARGWHVTAIDSSRAGLERAAELARAQGLKACWAAHAPAGGDHLRGHHASSARPQLLLVEADLEQDTLAAEEYGLILCFNYLQRSLFVAIERALRPGGMLLYETYTIEQLNFPEGPRNPDYLLRRHELRGAFPGLEVVFHREFCAGKGIASLLARKPSP